VGEFHHISRRVVVGQRGEAFAICQWALHLLVSCILCLVSCVSYLVSYQASNVVVVLILSSHLNLNLNLSFAQESCVKRKKLPFSLKRSFEGTTTGYKHQHRPVTNLVHGLTNECLGRVALRRHRETRDEASVPR
jgi:hypothetical protein